MEMEALRTGSSVACWMGGVVHVFFKGGRAVVASSIIKPASRKGMVPHLLLHLLPLREDNIGASRFEGLVLRRGEKIL